MRFFSLVTLFTILGAALGSPMLVGYYMKVARWRQSPGTIAPKVLDTSLMTHCTFYSAEIDSQGNVVVADNGDGRVYDEFHYWARSQNSMLKTLLSIGGWDLNTNDGTKGYFSSIASDSGKRETFANSAVAYARKYDFDGISVDWFFPAFTTQGGTSADKANFVKLITAVREAIDAEATSSGETALLLSITVSGNLDVADAGYDVPSLAPLVDFINVMTYDYAGDWSTTTQVHTDFPSAKDSLDFFLVQGAPKEKLLLSVATFGRSFTVKDGDSNDAVVDLQVSGTGTALVASNTAGLVAYYEILTLKQDSTVKTSTDGLSGGSILTYNTDQWVAYDDVDQVKVKAQYVVDNEFAGVMVWSVDLDDFANGFPLTSAVASTLNIEVGSTDTDAAFAAPTSIGFIVVLLAFLCARL